MENASEYYHERFPPESDYLKAAYAFAKSWLEGSEEVLLHTSGSTGPPKPILLKRSQLVASARMTGQALSLPEHTRALVCLHVRYIAGIMMLVRGLELGWYMTIQEPTSNPLEGFGPKDEFDFVAMVPLQLDTILRDKHTRPLAEKCGKILLGGAPVPASLEQELQKLTVPVYQSYGMTETVSHVALRRLNGPEAQADYQLLAGIEFGTDARGCLFLKGKVTDFELVQTNDLVTITSDHSFRWEGRVDSVLNSGGIKIQLEQVERKIELLLKQLGLHPSFFAWPENDPKLGQKLVLFMETEPNEEETVLLWNKFKADLHPYERPKAIYFVKKFDRTPTDKIDKLTISQAYFKTPKR